ncbi:hypothetical protein JCM15548_13966 [Geofilum rubicundum JCM 15548]|uniref:Uncharacterized protein n=1 Tax=Geofilum rubicundum JCM 15548 TaxID=1236989 RepID=A0A0E9M342_9BACT|nr:hypothetical protein JCM15548_13966 [Geofilum rubicundum JCM 15548]
MNGLTDVSPKADRDNVNKKEIKSTLMVNFSLYLFRLITCNKIRSKDSAQQSLFVAVFGDTKGYWLKKKISE